MKKIFFSCIGWYVSFSQTFALSDISRSDIGFRDNSPSVSILKADQSTTIIGVMSLIQVILLKVILPLVTVGAALFIAYQLLTAEGDETKLKKAWKSVAYTAMAMVVIATSYAFISIVSRVSL